MTDFNGGNLIFETMSLPFFYISDLSLNSITLPEETSRHVVQVLRKTAGDQLLLTDGKGKKSRVVIEDDNRKRCTVTVIESTAASPPFANVVIAISLIKNASRFEWFLEKATEIGVRQIIPLLCERTEKEKFRHDRLNAILISAMLQSQQVWLPQLSDPIPFAKAIEQTLADEKFIAHCLPEEKIQLSSFSGPASSLILIGPEGDFTQQEIKKAMEKGFKPVALGNTRLRTETAGIVAATLLCNRI